MSARATVASLVTAQELFELPDDGRRYELVEGELLAMSPAGFAHGDLALLIGARLRLHADRRQLGRVVGAETGFLLARGPDTVRAPDVAFVAAKRLPPAAERRGFLALAPDLVVEVVSPSDRAVAVTAKALAWLAAGSSLVWVVYPEQELVAVYRADGTVQHLRQGDALDGYDVLPGFTLSLADIFA